MFIDQWTKIAPKHWTRKKLKHVASLRSGESITADSIKDEGDFPVYGGNGLRGYTSEYTHEGEFVLIGRQGALCGNVNYARDRFWASEHAVVVMRLGDDDLTWLGELLRYLDLNRLSQSAAQPGISAEEVSNVLLAVPPLEEQRAISAYLTNETARLDALVAAKQRLIDLLAEKRKAIIATAVTRGLDPKVKRRDSGVPWLGEIPAHWEACQLRRVLASMDYGTSQSVEPEGLVVVLRMGDLRDGELDFSRIGYVDAVTDDLLLKPGDVLFNRTNSLDQIAKVAKFRGYEGDVSFASYLVRLRVNERVDSEFLNYLLNSPYVLARARAEALPAIGQANLNPNRYSYIVVAVPPLAEQHAIVEHIARETAKLDAVRAAAERTVALLKERRSALIAGAVTGQLDVGAA